jgi:Family of unknown function (DUF5724)/Domain of unknown function (DUF4132)
MEYKTLQDYVQNRGRKTPENFRENLPSRVNSLSGDAKELALWLTNLHADNTKFSKYDKISEILKTIPDEKSIWETSNYDTFWQVFFPKIWEKAVKLAWPKMKEDERYTMLYVFANEPILHELDLHEFMPFSSVYFPDGTFQYFCLATAAIDNGDEKLLKSLIDILKNQSEVGEINVQAILISMKSNKSELWNLIKNLLLAAQRQEGLRQMIFNEISSAHLGAKILLLQTIIDNGLLRFSSALATFQRWFCMPILDGKPTSEVQISQFIKLVIVYYQQPKLAIDQVLIDKNYLECYLQIWVSLQRDGANFWKYCDQLMQSADPQKRAMTLHVLSVAPRKGFNFAKKYVNDPDLMVCWNIFQRFQALGGSETYHKTDGTWEFFERLLDAIPDAGLKNLTPKFVWENYQFDVKGWLIHWAYRVARSLNRYAELLKYSAKMDGDLRQGILSGHFQTIYDQINAGKQTEINFKPTDFERNWIVNSIQDKSSTVMRTAFVFYNLLTPNTAELPVLVNLLSRKSDDTRKNILISLAKLKDVDLKSTIEILLNSKTEEQQVAGLDLLQQLKKQSRLIDFINESIKNYSSRRIISSKAELILHDLSAEKSEIFDETNGYGLYNPQNRAPMPILEKPTTGFFIEEMYQKPMFGLSISLEDLIIQIKKLDTLITANETYEYEILNYENNKEKVLLSNPFFQLKKSFSYNPTSQEIIDALPLAEIWVKWFNESKLTPIDCYFLSAYSTNYPFTAENIIPDWLRDLVKNYAQSYTTSIFNQNIHQLKYPSHCQNIIGYLRADNENEQAITAIELDLTVHYFASIPKENLFETMRLYTYMQELSATWRDAFKAYFANFEQWQMSAADWNETKAEKFSDELFARFWNVVYWYYRNLPSNCIGFQCCQEGILGRAYTMDLIGKDEFYYITFNTQIFPTVAGFPRLDYQNTVKRYPIYQELLSETIPHFLNIELKRGDTATPVSKFAQIIHEIIGLDYLVKIIKGLGKDSLNRGYSYGGESKVMQFSRFLRDCQPAKTETFDDFKKAMNGLKISEKRLIQIALYAPQWMAWAEQYLGWSGLQNAAWCLHAHCQNPFDNLRETNIAKYSSVSEQDFQDGAVDVKWYQTAFAELGEKRWEIVYDAAHYICENAGYVRARVYSDAILAKLNLANCQNRVTEKRNQNYVIALGLIPIDPKNVEKDILERYRFIQDFKKSGKKVGAQRQESEKRACTLALENLARNAGYPDPVRLTWAMETLDVQDLMARVNIVKIDETTVNLSVNALGKAEVLAEKAGRILAVVPPKLKKEASIIELIDIKNDLNSQYKRIRKSLEEAMIRGDMFKLSEIENLMKHPVIKPLLGSLILILKEKTGFYLDKCLKSQIGVLEKLTSSDEIRIAHCADLQTLKVWAAYQKIAFQEKIVQPFKQIFRELYVPSADEMAAMGISKRYEGYKIQPGQAAAMLRGRGWAANYRDGLQKVFHEQKLVAQIEAFADWSNSSPTMPPTEINSVRFFSKNDHKSLLLNAIPKNIFSEIMRDLDLVVSVAHVGGVDIESSLSSIELRAAIILETADFMKLNNVRVEKSHIFIKGAKNEYTIHLGSGIAHKIPSVMLNINPVSTQERGRIFLPFVDEDPKTAEIVSKMLLLAKDSEIMDPTILEQL